jgi:hypothetical protein|tara:strand:- start:227 stop:388 length:162 start_codon:yes stop_codon:yes gene_type:complete
LKLDRQKEGGFGSWIELLSITGSFEEGGISLKYRVMEIVEGEGIPDEIQALGR